MIEYWRYQSGYDTDVGSEYEDEDSDSDDESYGR